MTNNKGSDYPSNFKSNNKADSVFNREDLTPNTLLQKKTEILAKFGDKLTFEPNSQLNT